MAQSASHHRSAWTDTGLAVVAGVFGVFLSMRMGLLGFVSDHDMIFYGGWMVLNGKMPFVDFFGSHTILASMIQALFFKVMGVSWLAYVAHAGAYNGLYVVLLFLWLRRLGLPAWAAFIYALSAAATYMAPTGFPHPMKPAFVFLIIALLAQQVCLDGGSARRVLWTHILVPFLVLAAYLNHPNPTVIFPVLCLIPLLALPKPLIRVAAKGVGLGLGAIAVLMMALDLITGASVVRDFLYYMLVLPFGAGVSRMGSGLSFLKIAFLAQYSTLTLMLAIIPAVIWLGWTNRARIAEPEFRAGVAAPMALSLGFLATTIFHFSHVAQPAALHVTLIIPAVALFHAAVNRVMEGQRQAVMVLALLLVSYVALDANEYNRAVNKARKVYDVPLEIGATMARGATGLPELKDIQFIPVVHDPDYLEHFRDLLAAARETEGNVFFAHEPPMYYTFSRKAPVQPFYYNIPGHSTPVTGSVAEDRLIELFRSNLEAAKVDRVILDTAVLPSIFPEGEKTPGICGLSVRKLVTVVNLCPGVFAPGQPLARHLYLSHR